MFPLAPSGDFEVHELNRDPFLVRERNFRIQTQSSTRNSGLLQFPWGIPLPHATTASTFALVRQDWVQP